MTISFEAVRYPLGAPVVQPEAAAAAAAAAVIRPRALVLLAGAVRATRLTELVDRSLLDLPVATGRTVLDLWREEAMAAVERCGLDELLVRVVTNRSLPEPAAPADAPGVHFQIERDPCAFRGTAGLLHDLARTYGPEEWIVVASGAQVLTTPLAQTLKAMMALGGDVMVVAHADGSPSGLMLLRCGVLAGVRPVGYLDLKEQLLPAIAKDHPVSVLRRDLPTGLPVRTRPDYIRTLRWWHRGASLAGLSQSAFAEEWSSVFALPEVGAWVDPSARIHDSVVLRGGRVEAGAVVVRSIVGPGGRVPPGARVVDQLVGPATARSTREDWH